MLHAMTTETKSKTQSSGARSAVAAEPGRDREFSFADRPWSVAFNALNGQSSKQQRSQALRTLQRAIGNQAVLRMLANERARDGALQRKCACGGHAGPAGECAGCAAKRDASLQRHGIEPDAPATVPPIVNEVLRSPGQPLDASARAFMEPRFGYDFGEVRVHDDAKAARSAQSVNALAYTVGQHVVFDTGQYEPGSTTGNRLLAHELAHVVQQNHTFSGGTVERVSSPADDSERAANAAAELSPVSIAPTSLARTFPRATLFRTVGSVNCPPNAFGAPFDPRSVLETIDPIAVELANQAADSLATDAVEAAGGIPDSPSVTFQSYQDHFGLPNAVGSGFLNRLTGVVRPSQAIAMSEELHILSKRFRLIASLFSDTVNYRCPGDATVTLPGCGAGSCGTSFAFSCRGGLTIALCEPFWLQLTSDEAKAAALIHEATHMIWGQTGLSTPGEIGETTQRGPGRNFNVAGCYEFIIDDLVPVNSFPVCPDVPSPPAFG